MAAAGLRRRGRGGEENPADDEESQDEDDEELWETNGRLDVRHWVHVGGGVWFCGKKSNCMFCKFSNCIGAPRLGLAANPGVFFATS